MLRKQVYTCVNGDLYENNCHITDKCLLIIGIFFYFQLMKSISSWHISNNVCNSWIKERKDDKLKIFTTHVCVVSFRVFPGEWFA